MCTSSVPPVYNIPAGSHVISSLRLLPHNLHSSEVTSTKKGHSYITTLVHSLSSPYITAWYHLIIRLLSSPLLLTCTAQTTRSWFEDTLMHVTRSRLSPVFSRFNNTNGSLLSSVRSYTEKYLKWMMDSIVKYVNATV